MGAAVIAAADKSQLCLRDALKGLGRRCGRAHLSGIFRRTNQDKIIVHDFPPVAGVARRDKLQLRSFGMYKNSIDIARLPKPERLPGSDH